MKYLGAIAVVLLVAAVVAFARDALETTEAVTSGAAAARGHALIQHYGCGNCHSIPDVPGADALVGPPLDRIGSRVYIAGVLTNTPENMARWIQDPRAVDPLTAMPKLGVSDEDATNIVAYLYTLR